MPSIVSRRLVNISRSRSSICMSAWEGAELVSEDSSARAISVLLSWWRRSLRREEYVWGTGVDIVAVVKVVADEGYVFQYRPNFLALSSGPDDRPKSNLQQSDSTG
jgi:hypothetical protein